MSREEIAARLAAHEAVDAHAPADMRYLLARVNQLRDALERTEHALRAMAARKPVRDLDETLAEARAALDALVA